MADPYELPRLLARFKLQVRRQLNQSVDLEQLSRDSEYARTRLGEIEDLADDEELLVTLVRLRDLLCPTASLPAQTALPPEAETPDPVPKTTRNYQFGARSW